MHPPAPPSAASSRAINPATRRPPPPPSPPAPPAPPAPSFLSRLSQRFGLSVSSSALSSLSLSSPSSSKIKHHRAVLDFYIQPENPYRTYSAGDLVTGHVHLTLSKPLRISHITLCLHGFVRVSRYSLNPNDLGSSPRGSAGASARRASTRNDSSNSSASLMQEEITLCGEGRLKEGSYKLDFAVRFPEQNLPSSINFEKGAISYMLVSTLTRPAAISPILTCEKRLVYAEPIDIASLPPLKPKAISIESVKKRRRAARSGAKKYSSSVSESSNLSSTASSTTITEPDTQRHNGGYGTGGVNDVGLQSATSSENSSALSNHSQSRRNSLEEPQEQQQRRQRQRSADGNTSTDDASSMAPSLPPVTQDDKIVIATMEILKAGALPGDTLPVRILIKHTKPLRISNGVIITLYRQGLVDWTSQGDRVGSSSSSKSKSSLSLLTFGSGRTRSTYRKDLAQTFAPLMVDPVTMKASIKTSLRVPENLFPTIRHAPNDMISFRYYVEIVLDIRGKLDRYLPKAMPSSYSNFTACPPTSQGFQSDAGSNANPVWGLAGNILDTTEARREKSVVSSVFEVVLGTKDSGRSARGEQGRQSNDDGRSVSTTSTHESTNPLRPRASQPQFASMSSSLPPLVPLPPVQPEEEVDEKTRLRMAEQFLSPSQPPLVTEPASFPGALSGNDAPQQRIPMPISEYTPIAYASAPLLSEDDEQPLPYVASSEQAAAPAPPQIVPFAYGPPPTMPFDSNNNLNHHHNIHNDLNFAYDPHSSASPNLYPQYILMHDHHHNHHDQPSPSSPLPEYTHFSQADSSFSAVPTALPMDTSVPSHTQSHGGVIAGAGTDGQGEDKQELERRRLLASASAPPQSRSRSESESVPRSSDTNTTIHGASLTWGNPPTTTTTTTTAAAAASEDKQELERRRLLAAASSPDENVDGGGNGDMNRYGVSLHQSAAPPPPPVILPLSSAPEVPFLEAGNSSSSGSSTLPAQPVPIAPLIVEDEPGQFLHDERGSTVINPVSRDSESPPRYQS